MQPATGKQRPAGLARACKEHQVQSAAAISEHPRHTLLQIEVLHLVDSCITDPGLLRALPRSAMLRRLSLQGCWLASEAGLQAAAAAALQAGSGLHEVLRDRVPVAIPLPAGSKAAGTGTPAAKTAGGSRPSSGSGATNSPAGPRRSSTTGRLTAAILEHDERLAYSKDELLQLGAAVPLAGAAAAQLRASLPSDLRSPGQ